MRMQPRCALFGVLALTCMAGTSAYANVITNGDFQTGTLTGWTAFTTSNGTNGGGGLPDVVSFNTTGAGASDAAQFNVGEVNFDSTEQGGGLSQTFFAPVTGLYTLTENFASLDDANGSVNSGAGVFSILIDGLTVASDNLGPFSSPNQVLMGSFDVTVSLTAGSNTLATEITRPYISVGTGTPTEYVDNITLNPNTVTVTPEPSSFYLLGTAFAVLVGVGWRRNLLHATGASLS